MIARPVKANHREAQNGLLRLKQVSERPPRDNLEFFPGLPRSDRGEVLGDVEAPAAGFLHEDFAGDGEFEWDGADGGLVAGK